MNSVQHEAYEETLRLAAEYYKQLPGVSKPTSTVTSQHGLKGAEEDESVYIDSISNRVPPSLSVPAIPASILHQWYLYTCFTKQALCSTIDWRSVVPFVDSVTTPCAASDGGATAVQQSGLAFVRSLARTQVQAYGRTSFPALYQRAVRWTIVLYKLIRDRVRYLLGPAQKGAQLMAATTATTTAAAEHLLAAAEGERYVRLFLHNARSLLTNSQHTLLGNLLFHKQLEEEPASCGSVDARVAPSAGPAFSSVIALSHRALNADVLKITWDILNPNLLAEIVTDKLQRPKNVLSPPHAAADASAAAPAAAIAATTHLQTVHTATFELLFKWQDSAAGQGSDAGPAKALTFDEVGALQTFLERAAYLQTVKWESGFLEFSYYSFPFVVDFAVWRRNLVHSVNLLKSQGVPFVDTTLFLVQELGETLASCSYILYIKEIQHIYQDYSKNAKATASRAFLPITAGKVSPNTVRALAQVIEPTMNLTKRVRHGVPSILCSTVREYIEELHSVIIETVQAELKCYESSSTPSLSALAKTDLDVVRQYMGEELY